MGYNFFSKCSMLSLWGNLFKWKVLMSLIKRFRIFILAVALVFMFLLSACTLGGSQSSNPIDINLPLSNSDSEPTATPNTEVSAGLTESPSTSASPAPNATARPTSSIDASTITGNEDIKEEEKLSYSEYRALNSDVVGWIKIKDTNVDYPIVQSHDNEEYLTLTPTLVES